MTIRNKLHKNALGQVKVNYIFGIVSAGGHFDGEDLGFRAFPAVRQMGVWPGQDFDVVVGGCCRGGCTRRGF